MSTKTTSLELKLYPVKIVSGAIVASNGQEIITMNRDANTTPLTPTERDQLLMLIAGLLNERLNGYYKYTTS